MPSIADRKPTKLYTIPIIESYGLKKSCCENDRWRSSLHRTKSETVGGRGLQDQKPPHSGPRLCPTEAFGKRVFFALDVPYLALGPATDEAVSRRIRISCSSRAPTFEADHVIPIE